MKKIYAFLLALLTVVGWANAQVVFDFTTDDSYAQFGLEGFSSGSTGQQSYSVAGDFTDEKSLTNDGVTLTVTPVSDKPCRVFSGSLRVYGGTLTVASSTTNISNIKFVLNSNKWGAGNTADTGTLTTGSWTGSAMTVTITIAATTQIKSIEVYLEGGDAPVVIDWTSSANAPLTVAQVLEKGAGLAAGDGTTEYVYVKGFVVGISEIGTVNETTGQPYGNASYYIADLPTGGDKLYVYRGMGLNGNDIAEGDIAVGDEVVVMGKIKNYAGDEGEILEVTNSKIYSLNGETGGGDQEEPISYSPQGDGESLATAYNVDAVRSKSDDTTEEGVWVKALILGFIDGSSLTVNTAQCGAYKTDGSAATASNLLLIDEAHNIYTTKPDIAYMLPVQLPSGDVRTALNLADNSDLVGKTVYLYGNVQKYMGVPGLKSVTKYSFDGTTILPGGGEDPVDPSDVEIASIARAKAAATTTRQTVVFKANDLLVTHVNGKSVYVYDGTDGLLLYGTNSGISVGDIITADVKGELYLYNGMTEIATTAYDNLTVSSSGNAVTPQEVSIADITNNYADYENELVIISGLNPAAEAWANRNITFVDDSDNELVVRDNWNVATTMSFDPSKTYTVTGFVARYNTTVQLYPRAAEDLDNGEAPEEFVPEGSGLLNDAYTVNDVLHLNIQNNGEGNPSGWVTGYIVGYVSGSSYVRDCVFSNQPPAATAETRADEEPVVSNTNILLADAADVTDPAKCIPVQLLNKLAMRESLSLRDNPEHLGKQVWIEGTFDTYFNVRGVKEVVDWSFDGEHYTTRIQMVNAESHDGTIFTIAGQRVNSISQPGLYIVGGKKMLVK